MDKQQPPPAPLLRRTGDPGLREPAGRYYVQHDKEEYLIIQLGLPGSEPVQRRAPDSVRTGTKHDGAS